MNSFFKKRSVKITLIAAAVLFLLYSLLATGFILYRIHVFFKTRNEAATAAAQSTLQAKSPVELSPSIPITINGSALAIDPGQPDKWYDVPMLTTEQDTPFVFGDFQGYEVTVNGKASSKNSTVNVRLQKLTKQIPITITLKNMNTSAVTKYYIRTENNAMPDITALGKGIEKGFYYTALNGFIFKMDYAGNLVFYKQAPNSSDFKMTKVNGEVEYSYLGSIGKSGNTGIITNAEPALNEDIILDKNYNVIDHIPFLLPNGDTPPNSPLDMHDFTILGDRHYLIESYVQKRVTNIPPNVPHSAFGARVQATVIQEIDHGKVIWQWDSTEHPELYGISVEGNDFYNTTIQLADYMHFNSMTVDPSDQNLICSFRNLDSVLKIDRKTGKILWILGGKGDQFGLTADQKFSRQHFARLTDNGDLTLFDNGANLVYTGYPPKYDGSGKGVTRILEMKLDQKNKKLLNYNAFSLDKQYSAIMGSVTKLVPNSNVFMVGWGGRVTSNAIFSLIDFSSNKVLFEAVYPVNPQNWGDNTYRAYWFDE
jgi:arylsulfate sulfotransferase